MEGAGADPEGFLRRVAAVEEAARSALWAEGLTAGSPAFGAAILDRAVRGTSRREPAAVASYPPLLDLPALAERVGPRRMAEVLEVARAAELEGCLFLLEHPGPPAAREQLGPPPDPLLETLSLGHRKAAARGSRGSLLDRLLRDPDPRVVGELLRNPRLREGEVVAVASRRPCPEEVFWRLVRIGRWLRRPPVQVAVVLNPYAPPRLALALEVLLDDPTLESVPQQQGLHPAVREGALVVLGWRGRVPPAA